MIIKRDNYDQAMYHIYYEIESGRRYVCSIYKIDLVGVFDMSQDLEKMLNNLNPGAMLDVKCSMEEI